MSTAVKGGGLAGQLDRDIDHAVIDDNATAHATTAHGAVHETFLGMDSYAWVGLAFVAFMLILWRVGAFRGIAGALDSRADRVRTDLAEASALRAEAEAMKTKAAADAAQAEADAKAVIANAEAEAQRIVEQASHDAEEAMRRRTRMAEDRIAAEARTAEAELRARASDITVRAAREILAERSRQGDLSNLVDAAIANLGKR